MSNFGEHYDVIVVGASVSGIFTALEFAKRGIKTLVIEKNSSEDSYKVICSHILHPNVVHEFKTLGIWEEIKEAGGQETFLEVNFEGQGSLAWPLSRKATFANAQRRIIDPILRRVLKSTPGIHANFGERVVSLIRDESVRGVVTVDRAGIKREYHSSLVVAADGVSSPIARLDGIQQKTYENGRVGLFAYFERLNFDGAGTRVWALNQGESFIGHIPNGDRVICNAYIPIKQYEEVKENIDQFFETVLEQLVEKGLKVGTQLTPLYVAKRTSTSKRSKPSNGLVFVGDARLSADVMTGIGCSWAVVSAKLLVNSVSRPLIKARNEPNGNQKSLQRSLTFYHLKSWARFEFYAWIIGWTSRDMAKLLHPKLVSVAIALFGRAEANQEPIVELKQNA